MKDLERQAMEAGMRGSYHRAQALQREFQEVAGPKTDVLVA